MLKTRLWPELTWLLFMLLVSVFGCKTKPADQALTSAPEDSANWDRRRAAWEYRLIMAEQQLAQAEKLYLVFDLKKRKLVLKLSGAVVWDDSLKTGDDDFEELRAFAIDLNGRPYSPVFPLAYRHLFTATEMTPDSVIDIVSDALNVDGQLLQRDIPGRLLLEWEEGLILEVQTQIQGRPTSLLKNTFAELRRSLKGPFVKAHALIEMDPDDALTFFGAAQPGLSTLLYALPDIQASSD